MSAICVCFSANSGIENSWNARTFQKDQTQLITLEFEPLVSENEQLPEISLREQNLAADYNLRNVRGINDS